ncbi:MAG: GTPase [Thermoprotei archaeon]|nr:MAG: GTPase [Thermoprotei archaeon]
MVTIGLIGKTNVGKTTFFNAATLLEAEISTYPFTTKKPNEGVAYVHFHCVCKEFKVKDNPVNSTCINGWRFAPVKIVDIPGLIKEAWRGRGLGIRFLSVAAVSDALIHVVDASGSIDEEGRIVKPGIGDPVRDFRDVERELVQWYYQLLKKNSKHIAKLYKQTTRLDLAISRLLAGIKITLEDAQAALIESELLDKDFAKWNDDDFRVMAYNLRKKKPTLIVANKMDLPYADENYEALTREYSDYIVIPCSAEAELALRRAEKSGLVEYVPGEEMFFVKDKDRLTKKQRWALEYVQEKILSKYFRTGVQYALDVAVFKLLSMNAIFPVADEKNLTDSKGRVLPDVYLMPPGSTLYDLAAAIHSELAKSLVCGIDARMGLRLPKNYLLRHRDVIKLVVALKRK